MTSHGPPPVRRPCRGRREGATLFLALVLVLLVSVLGAGLLQLGEGNCVEAARRLSRAQAFWAAEAGLAEAEALAWQNKERKDGTDAFPDAEPDLALSGSVLNGAYDVTVSRTSDDPPTYRVTSRGVSDGGMTNEVEMTVEQAGALSMGLFGHTEVVLVPGTLTHVGTFSGVHAGAYVGSNGLVSEETGGGSFTLRGKVLLGAAQPDEREPAENETRFEDQYVGYIDPDPLGITNQTSALHLAMQAAQAAGNPSVTNDAGQSLISTNGFEIVLDVDENAVLQSGTYFFTDVRVRPGRELAIGAEVTVFLEGGTFRMDSGARLEFPGYSREPFIIYADTDESLSLQCAEDFYGLVYAPRADLKVDLDPGRNFQGVAWADTLRVEVSGSALIALDLELQGYDYFKDYAYRLETRDWDEDAP